MKILLGLFLIAHALIHLSFISPAPAAQPGAPAWPFDITKSWIGLSAETLKPIGTVLTIVATVGFILAALAVLGLLVPVEWTNALILAASVASIVLVILFWNSWFIMGPLIDVALIIYFFYLVK